MLFFFIKQHVMFKVAHVDFLLMEFPSIAITDSLALV